MRGELSLWTVYDHPRDYPAHIVIRRSFVAGGEVHHTDDVILCDSIEVARELLAEAGRHRLDRHPDDDPVIVEVWL